MKNYVFQHKGKLKGALIFFAIFSYWMQAAAQDENLQIRGRVTDENGPLTGISVKLRNTTLGTSTDKDGYYQMEITSNEGTLIFTYVGYHSIEMPLVPGQLVYDVLMTQDLQGLDEVVVVGFTQQQRANVTGAVSTVRSEALMKTPSPTVSGALVGQVQGITTRAGDSRPGNGVALQIRNLGNPLYIIDNVPSDAGTFNQLAAEDIDNISILKDGAASVYGLRAANGVVLVTTKRGQGSTTINASGYYGLQNFTRYPRPANAYQHVRANVESDQNFNITPAITPDELDRWRLGEEPGYQSFDYYNMIMRPNVPQTYLNANAAGGNDNVDYYMSVSHLYQEALIRDFSFDRTNIQANLDAKLAKGLKVGTQIFGRIENRNDVGVPGIDDYFQPFLSIFTMWPTERPYANDNPNYVNGDVHNINANPATFTRDITGYSDDQWQAFRSNFTAEYNTDFGLRASGLYSYGYIIRNYDSFEYTYDAYSYDPVNDRYPVVGGNPNPYRYKERVHRKERYGRFMLNYNKVFGEHNLEAVAAYEWNDWENTDLGVQTNPPNNYIPIQYFENQINLTDNWAVEARAGYIGRLNYNYKGRYLVEAIGRYDGSFLYAPGRRWGFFPGASLGWRISDESFIGEGVKNWLNDLKLRVSYGQTGSEMGVLPFQYLPGATYGNPGQNAVFGGVLVTGSALVGLPVTNLSWVTNESSNVGVDFGFFGGKLSGTVDVFQRKRTGLPASRYDVVLPSEVGYTLPNENLNSDLNRGVEGALRYAGKIREVNYSIGGNATFSRMRFIDAYRPRFQNSWDEYRNAIEGRFVGYNDNNDLLSNTWGYQVIGRFASQEEIDHHPIDIDGQGNRTLLPGDFIYQDVNGDGIINEMDERPIGYTQGTLPIFTYAVNGSFEWKSFSLSFDLVGAGMQTFMRDWELRHAFQNNGTSPDYMFEDRWHREDPYDPYSAWIPGTYPATRRNNNNHANNRTNDFWVTNVRYLRLRNLELGYTFSENITKSLGISRLRIYANGTNLLTFDNVKAFGIDPEITSTNGLVYPQQRLYNFGFNLTL